MISGVTMELYDVMRTTFAVREFTADPLPDDILYRILDNARFAPSGGNRQAAHIIVVRDATVRLQLAELAVPGARRYVAQIQAGENPWNPLQPCTVAPAVVENTEVPDTFTAPFLHAPVVLVVSVDMSFVAAMDQDLDRIGVVSGASVYPLVWNLLLAARNEGYGGTVTTMAVPEEPRLRTLLSVPDTHAVAAVVPLGKPVRQLSKLRRQGVETFTTRERFDGQPFQQDGFVAPNGKSSLEAE
jgi:nitroreductase